MPHHLDPDAFGFLIADLARLMRAETDRRVAEAGLDLTQGEGRALAHAARAGTVRQNVLAERMGLEAMTVSGQLDRLEARGLVRRVPDPSDRRAKLVMLTDEADAVLPKIQSVGGSLRKELAETLGQDDWAALNAALKSLRDHLLALREATSRSHESASA